MFVERRKKYKAGALVLLLFVFSCRREEPNEKPQSQMPDVVENAEYLAGGLWTVYNSSAEAFNQIDGQADAATTLLHNEGALIFNTDFTELGTSDFSGLGPLFIQSSCVGCHPGNGRSQPPLSEVDYNSGLLMRFSLSGAGEHGEPIAVPGFGTQLQNRAIGNETPEGQYQFQYQNYLVSYDDGTDITLHNPSHQILDPYTSLPPNILYSMRIASPIFGLGLLESIPESDILEGVDETDNDGDYISGKANFVWNIKTQQMELGRFGWKAANPTIHQQVASAFNEDMGITSAGYFPVENGVGQPNCVAGIGVDPDVMEEVIDKVSFYIHTLGVPSPRNLEDSVVMRGRQLFDDLNCVGCHKRSMQTWLYDGPDLSAFTIYPYTDMLIHDMGEILADGRPDFDASTNEWRTPPLWGIGLTHLVNPNARYLHDGRAATLEEAILWHGGEANWVIEDFKALSVEDRNAIIAFLEAL